MKIKNSLTFFLIAVTCLQAYYIKHLRKEILSENSSEYKNIHTNDHIAGINLFEKKSNIPLVDSFPGTLPISSALADSARSLYLQNDRHLTINNGVTTQPLEGFVVNKNRLSSLLTPATYLYLAFGVNPSEFGTPDSLQNFTLYVYGLDGNKEFIKSRNKPIVYEYLAPCPSSCPM